MRRERWWHQGRVRTSLGIVTVIWASLASLATADIDYVHTATAEQEVSFAAEENEKALRIRFDSDGSLMSLSVSVEPELALSLSAAPVQDGGLSSSPLDQGPGYLTLNCHPSSYYRWYDCSDVTVVVRRVAQTGPMTALVRIEGTAGGGSDDYPQRVEVVVTDE